MKSKIAVAVSGGVDSLIAAHLLKKQNNDVIGLHFLTGYEQTRLPDIASQGLGSTESQKKLIIEASSDHPIYQIASQLAIPIFLVDCCDIFRNKIVDYFINDYLSGRTPNPCMICNPAIKFGTILNAANDMGATHLATGHYARIEKIERKRYRLKKGIDVEKDQSYFLALLSQSQLSAASFPLGGMTKKQVIELARQEGLSPVTSNESQDICFIKCGDYVKFLGSQKQFSESPGPITNISGKILGYHNGLHRYTVGQRRGINCPAANPYYVIKINKKENVLVVGFKEELYKSECVISNINWIAPIPSSPLKVFSRIRYRHHAVESVLIPLENDKAIIRFSEPQPAVAPGQAAVCYLEDEIIAGGFIDDYLS
jgi:tRNA-uridine 2-sulfurtransferase